MNKKCSFVGTVDSVALEWNKPSALKEENSFNPTQVEIEALQSF